MITLPTNLRRQLESVIKQARKIAEVGARKALEALAVHEPDPYRHMDEAQRTIRRKLRAQAKQLGDSESQTKRGAYETEHLVEKLAYDQWHRLLFARFLLDNNLLISPEHGVSVTLDDCEELAPSLGLNDAWSVAARFAAKELPEIFRDDDPAGAVEIPAEDRNPLIQLVTSLPVAVFTASDSLGWCYQFWQADRKETVNDSGNKIGADELPAVTQLFTEDYMVDFLLDNTLGAWHAGKALAANPKLAETAQSEVELRNAIALPQCHWKYLRFVKGEGGRWAPAAGTYDGWPRTANQLTCLDPCMGSGHFVVAMFERLVALRIEEENLDEVAAVSAVIRDNLFGLEIDPRCTQIAAFNLALAAWRRVGHRALPPMHLACSGLAPNTREADWLAIAGNNEKLKNGMNRLYRLFKDAPILGSLINPRLGADDLYIANYHELEPLLEKALAQETVNDTVHEMTVTARGLAKAAELLAGQFTLVATNVPYRGANDLHPTLKELIKVAFPSAQKDLATCFLERCLSFCSKKGTTAVVSPQSWLFIGPYQRLRKHLLSSTSLTFVAQLGKHAFETITGEVVNVNLTSVTNDRPTDETKFCSLDVCSCPAPSEKAQVLRNYPIQLIPQLPQLKNPDSRIVAEAKRSSTELLLRDVANSYKGIATGDLERFIHYFWEHSPLFPSWSTFQGRVDTPVPHGGREQVLLWENGQGQLYRYISERLGEESVGAWLRGEEAWGHRGIAIGQMTSLPCTLYSGDLFDENTAAVIPKDESDLLATWVFCQSQQYRDEVKKLDNSSLKIPNLTLIKVPFDINEWRKVAAQQYPSGLPKSFSSDPTQWLFNGHPKDSDQPLHAAVARLLCYQWPRQTGSSFPDCPALAPDGLEQFADDDGIVCNSSTKGELPAAERLRRLLVQALGKFDLSALIAAAGPKGSKSETVEEWLRDEFFEQHCALFHHRPFIWHVWDGHKSGFSALVNYHLLTHANLEKLTYAYLGDWIRRQQAAVEAGEAGSGTRLQAAKQLQARLKLILEGEPPYDIFVRWKPLSKQAIGWHPDINDGVRLNIRPFAMADILRKRVKVKWEKDRGKEPVRGKKDFPWFWKGGEFIGDRLNDIHLNKQQKEDARHSGNKTTQQSAAAL